ncbi:MAG: PilN domain-containing protein [Candidatus Omnitrophica bacterium]|nr:PilN domain-containing protein [Candidatus Omnitrophota bacterium]
MTGLPEISVIGRNIDLGRTKKVLVVPRSSVFLKFVDVPSQDVSEIMCMAEFQAVKAIPLSKEDLIVSSRNLGSFRQGFSSLMLAAADKESLKRRIHEAERREEKIETIRLHTELLYLYLSGNKLISEDSLNFVIYIGKEESELLIIDKLRVIFSRGFKSSENFFDEIDRSVVFYEKDKDSVETKNVIVVYPSDVDIEDAKPSIKEHFSVPVVFYEHISGLARLDSLAEIDLLPKETKRLKSGLRRKQELSAAYLLSGLALVLFCALISFRLHEKKELIDVLSAKIEKTQPLAQTLDEYLKKITAAKEYIGRGSPVAGILQDPYSLIPRDMSILGMTYDGKGAVSYSGISRGKSDVFLFVKKLEGLKYFNTAQLKHVTSANVRGESVIEFEVQCRLLL